MVSSSLTRRTLLGGIPALLWNGNLKGANERSRSGSAVDRLLDQVVENEAKVHKLLSERTPIVETYIQEEDGNDGRTGEWRDHYFLGRMGSVQPGGYVSLIRRQSAPAPVTEVHNQTRFAFFNKKVTTQAVPRHVQYMPEGFAQMAVIDPASFNRSTYKFEYIRREFLGEVRCLVFDVAPNDPAGAGRFVGRIWVDDQTYCITRANGAYQKKSEAEMYFHFDSWRVNHAPGVWTPAVIYIEDSVSLPNDGASASVKPVRFKAQTRIWGYENSSVSRLEELTSILVESANKVNDTEVSKELSPLDGQRRWEGEAEKNVLDRLERVGLLAPGGEVDSVLATVLNNLAITNSIDIEARCRILLTTPFETFTIGQTVVISRGLVDVLPDEASLALVLATEFAHITLGHPTRTEYAFNDRLMVTEEEILENFRFTRAAEEVSAASKKAVELLANSPYKDKLANAGLFLKALKERAPRLQHLISATLGNDLTRYLEMPEFQAILKNAPPLEESKLEQISALPLGSRIRVDPWTSKISLMKSKPVALLSAREKMEFEVTPVNVFLTRVVERPEN